MGLSRHGRLAIAGGLALASALFVACDGNSQSVTAARQLTGSPWVPNVSGAGAANHDPNVTVTKTVLPSVPGPLTGLGQGWTGNEISVDIDMTEDLGDYGSFTLLAVPTGFPSSLQGGAYPVLTYLYDGTNELVNLSRSGAGNCMSAGAYTCTGQNCTDNDSCSIGWPSAYFDRTHWLQHQLNTAFTSYVSVNTFPTCNWTTGTMDPSSSNPYSNPECAFNTNFFVSNKLVSGVHYTARYVLLTDSYASITGYDAGVQVSLIKKSKNVDTNSGALDLNLIFVGYDVSQASRNAKGQINLDSMLTQLQSFYGIPGVNVKLGAINAYEWTDGDQYADLTTEQFGQMAAAASSIVQPSSEGKAINVFFVDSVTGNSSLLGESGGIGGPMVNGLPNSGVVVSTFGKLDQFNSECNAAPCALTQIDYDFATIEQTLAHELGHYLGLESSERVRRDPA